VSSSKRKKLDPEARIVLEELKEAEVQVATSPENVTRVEKNCDPEVETGRDNRQGVGIEIQVTEEDQDQSPKRIDEEILRGDQGVDQETGIETEEDLEVEVVEELGETRMKRGEITVLT